MSESRNNEGIELQEQVLRAMGLSASSGTEEDNSDTPEPPEGTTEVEAIANIQPGEIGEITHRPRTQLPPEDADDIREEHYGAGIAASLTALQEERRRLREVEMTEEQRRIIRDTIGRATQELQQRGRRFGYISRTFRPFLSQVLEEPVRQAYPNIVEMRKKLAKEGKKADKLNLEMFCEFYSYLHPMSEIEQQALKNREKMRGFGRRLKETEYKISKHKILIRMAEPVREQQKQGKIDHEYIKRVKYILKPSDTQDIDGWIDRWIKESVEGYKKEIKYLVKIRKTNIEKIVKLQKEQGILLFKLDRQIGTEIQELVREGAKKQAELIQANKYWKLLYQTPTYIEFITKDNVILEQNVDHRSDLGKYHLGFLVAQDIREHRNFMTVMYQERLQWRTCEQHVHVGRSGEPCWGNAHPVYIQLMSGGHIAETLTLAWNFLHCHEPSDVVQELCNLRDYIENTPSEETESGTNVDGHSNTAGR